jgi:nucleoside-diphosphate-sugar epimerase
VPSIQDIHNPRWSYASAKLAGEVAVNSASIEFHALTVIVRYHNVYGPNMGPGHFLSDFIARARNGVFEVIGAEETRSFTHISDAIDGTIAALLVADGSAEVFHLGSDEEFNIGTAAEMILTEMKIENPVLTKLPGRLGSVERRVADSSKVLRILNWQAKIDFKEGIADYLANTYPL